MTTRGLTEKLIVLYLNICGGRWFQELVAYLQAQKHAVDVFCFQEALFSPVPGMVETRNEITGTLHRADSYMQMCLLLQEYQPFFTWYARLSENPPLYIGNAMFVRTGRVIQDVTAQGDIMVYRRRDSLRKVDETANLETLPRNLQYASLELRGGRELTVFNFHGMWNANGKVDIPLRLHQFQRIRDAVGKFPGPKILGGDFNTFPTSRASIMLEDAGMQNLVRMYNINGTRSRFYERKDAKGTHADNVFVQGVQIAQFSVPEAVEISDHLPLLVTCTF